MEFLNWFFSILTILIACILSITVWSRKELKYKVLSLVLGSFCFIISYVSMLEILSRPKPKNLELLNKYANELTLLHVNWIEGEAIYLLVQLDDLREPRLYKFPWNASQAQEYDEMLEKGRESGEEVKITNPFYPTNSEEKKTLIYSSPAKPLPEKEASQPGITSYDPAIEDKLLESRDKRK